MIQIGTPGSPEPPRGYRCTDTVLEITVEMSQLSPIAWRASCDWAKFHGIDVNRVPADSTIVRDLENRRVSYTEYVFNNDGDIVMHHGEPVIRPAHTQGETEPLPFPPELWRTLEGVTGVSIT